MLALEGMAVVRTQVRVRGQNRKAHLCRWAGCKGAPVRCPPGCSLPGRGECGCAEQGERGLCRCESRETRETTGPSHLRGEEGGAFPDESTLGSWPPRKQGREGRRPWVCSSPREAMCKGSGSLGLGPKESRLPGRLVTGSAVDPSAPVPKEKPAQNASASAPLQDQS